MTFGRQEITMTGTIAILYEGEETDPKCEEVTEQMAKEISDTNETGTISSDKINVES